LTHTVYMCECRYDVKALRSKLEEDIAKQKPARHSAAVDYSSQLVVAPPLPSALDFQYLLNEGDESSV